MGSTLCNMTHIIQDNRVHPPPLANRLKSVFLRTWDLGFTAFGGPPVHFQIFHSRFVEKYNWIDDQTYQELFAVCQALPGPASTKLGYCICLTHAGFLPAVLSFTLWCLPGAIGMYALALSVSHISETLPDPVYALLSGLNSATVGIIAVAAVNLSEKGISDHMSRLIVIGSACAGLCYSALWYFPALMVISGVMTLVWDVWGIREFVAFVRGGVKRVLRRDSRRADVDVLRNTSRRLEEPSEDRTDIPASSGVTVPWRQSYGAVVQRAIATPTHVPQPLPVLSTLPADADVSPYSESSRAGQVRGISVQVGLMIVACFFISFFTVMLVRGVVKRPPVEFRLFSNLFLAGTIIFGGGPVVIPLLREYIVTEGWVSSRDFLIGLAMIQSFPGPNFNFAVFLSALTASSTNSPPIVTAILGFFGMFMPGMVLATGVSAIWLTLRRHRSVVSMLRGVNAAAVGLVWTAVYRLWQVGYLRHGDGAGVSLGARPWWVVVAAVAFSGSKWFGIPPPAAIGIGGIMGLLSSFVMR